MSRWFERFGFAEVADDLLIGAYPVDAEDISALSEAGVEVLVNLCEDAEYEAGERETVTRALGAAGIEEHRLPVPDYGNLPRVLIAQAVDDVMDELAAGRRVYLHCRAGWQRSAAIAAGVVAVRDHTTIDAALRSIRRRKPTAQPLDHQHADLLSWWEGRQSRGG
jgi:atypical dual specificity phosphatase